MYNKSSLPKRFLPVIHCVCPYEKGGVGHALSNARTAIENGADGVILIGHRVDHCGMCEIYEQVRKQFPSIWIGINFLDIAAVENWVGICSVVKRCIGLNGLWIDGMPDEIISISASIEVFGGVAFKYKDPNITGRQLADACEKAVRVVNVVTTSGNKTGGQPEISKLEEIREYIGGEFPFALASGVSAENIFKFLHAVDIFLVSSSIIERRNGADYFVSNKVKELAGLIHRQS